MKNNIKHILQTSIIILILGLIADITGLIDFGAEIINEKNIIDLEDFIFNTYFQPTFETRQIRLFAESKRIGSDNIYVITNTCLSFRTDNGDELAKLNSYGNIDINKGRIVISITTKEYATIEKIEIEVIDYKNIDLEDINKLKCNVAIGGMGGGGYVKEMQLEKIEILPKEKTYIASLDTRYELPSETSINFIVPVVFQEYGFYEYTAYLTLSGQKKRIQITPNYYEKNKTFSWMYINNINLDEIELVSLDDGDLYCCD